jgi:hypothetical protein
MQKIKVVQDSATGFCFWLTGWLFTLGFLGLSFGQGILAIIIWPYYLGAHFSAAL